jgi:hypothetical protein
MEDCETAGDEDSDGAADCADADCFNHAWCQTDYAVPLYEYSCDNAEDDDGDELVDCADDDCLTSSLCGDRYAAPID